jgi:hypothetical protein
VLVAGRKKKKRRDSSDNDDISQVIMAALEELRNATTTFKVGSPMDPRRLHRRRRIPTLTRLEAHQYLKNIPLLKKVHFLIRDVDTRIWRTMLKSS